MLQIPSMINPALMNRKPKPHPSGFALPADNPHSFRDRRNPDVGSAEQREAHRVAIDAPLDVGTSYGLCIGEHLT